MGVGTIGEKVAVSPRVVISAQTNLIIHEVAVACPAISLRTDFRIGQVSEVVSVPLPPVSAFTGVGSLLPSFIPSVVSIQATAQANFTAAYLSIPVSQAVATTGVD